MSMYDTPQSVTDSHTPPPETEAQEFPRVESEGTEGTEVPAGEEAPAGQPLPVPSAASDDIYAEFGGRQAVADAMLAMQAFETEQGITAVAVESLAALGFDRDFVNSLFTEGGDEEEQAPPDPYADLEDGEVLTVAQAKEMAQYYAQQEIARSMGPVENAIEEQRQTAATASVQSTLEYLGVKDESMRHLVIQNAQQYLHPDDWDPQNISRAVMRGHADTLALVQKGSEAYLAGKRQTRDSLPTNVGGRSSTSSSGQEQEGEAQSIAEAIARVRKMARTQG